MKGKHRVVDDDDDDDDDVEKTKCKKTFTSREHNAGHQEMNTANKAFASVAKFMFFCSSSNK